MTYEQFVYRLRKFQAVRIHLDDYEIDILLNEGFIYVGSLSVVPLQIFYNLPDALELWHHSEDTRPLGEIINKVDDKDVFSNPAFREMTILDPKLLVEPTNLLRNSMTGGVSFPDSSVERNVQSMMESMAACLYNVTLETKIYHTLKWQYLKEMLDKQRILFRNPSDYHDAWENFIFRKYDWEGGTDECRGQLAEAGKNLYCSCWSVCEESDGLWNNHVRGSLSRDNCPVKDKSQYVHKQDGSIDFQPLKIETTVGDLLFYLNLDKVFGGQDIWRNFRAGLVNYFNEVELRTFKERTLHMMEARNGDCLQFYLSNLIVQSFFMKRKQFEYEQELRLVLFGNAESLQKEESGIYLQTEPCRWIHEIVVNPDCSENDYEYILKQLSTTYGIDRVVKSPLTQRFCLK